MTSSKRRTPEQWQALVAQWRDSGQSAARFCAEHCIGYVSFCQWRKRFGEADAGSPAPQFIDLGTLAARTGPGAWRIVLSLGQGVELRLSQG